MPDNKEPAPKSFFSMSKQRIEALSDGIFAIVMTLLVIEIKVPEIDHEHFSNEVLLHDLNHLAPLFWSFFLSFAVITTTWVSHHFIFTLAVKNISRGLMYMNMLFLSFVSLLPFSSHLLGSYPNSNVAVAFYSSNILIISVLIFVIRRYIENSEKVINNLNFSPMDRFYGDVRNGLTIGLPVLAILLTMVNTYISVFILVVSVVINVIPGFIGFITRVTGLDRKARAKAESMRKENMQSYY